MNSLLRPYSEFPNSHNLAENLQFAVGAAKDILKQRNLRGAIKRYGAGFDLAQEKAEKGIHEHRAGVLGHYAVIGSEGKVVGAASIFPNLRLRKVHLPIPSRFVRWTKEPLTVEATPGGPAINGWSYEQGLLPDVYNELANMATKYLREEDEVIWTTEPTGVDLAHQAIQAADFIPQETARFYDGEKQPWLKATPLSTLYVQKA